MIPLSWLEVDKLEPRSNWDSGNITYKPSNFTYYSNEAILLIDTGEIAILTQLFTLYHYNPQEKKHVYKSVLEFGIF